MARASPLPSHFAVLAQAEAAARRAPCRTPARVQTGAMAPSSTAKRMAATFAMGPIHDLAGLRGEDGRARLGALEAAGRNRFTAPRRGAPWRGCSCLSGSRGG